MTIDCPHCTRAIRELEIDANVTLHEHLAEAPGCARRFRTLVDGWGGATWTASMSGAA